MTVQELIERLQEMPQDARVTMDIESLPQFFKIRDVEVDYDGCEELVVIKNYV